MYSLFHWSNSMLPLPLVGIVAVWAVIAGVASMVMYQRWSPQKKLADLIADLAQSQKALKEL